MNYPDERSRGVPLQDISDETTLLLAAPTRRPIDPMRALAILSAEAAAAAAGGLRAATEALSRELGEAMRMS